MGYSCAAISPTLCVVEPRHVAGNICLIALVVTYSVNLPVAVERRVKDDEALARELLRDGGCNLRQRRV